MIKILFLMTAVLGVQSAEFRVPNPGFEQGSTGWAFAAGGMSSVSGDAARSGSFGLLVADQTAARGSNIRSKRLGVMPGDTVQVDFSAKIVSGDGIAVYLEFYTAERKLLGSAADQTQVLRPIPSENKEWTTYSLAGKAPADAKTVAIWVHSFSGSQVTACFDDFSLLVVPESALKKFMSAQASSAGTPAADVVEFKKENAREAFWELKIFQPDGSVFRLPKEDWTSARNVVKQNPAWQDWVAGKRTEVDRWIARKRDRTEWEAGWNHAFISPIDHSFLVWTDEVPGEDIDHFISKSGDRVEITPTLFRAWAGAFRKNNASMVIEAAYLYHLTEDNRYAEWVCSQLDFYADNYTCWGSGVAQCKNSWLGYQSLDDAVIVSRLIDATRLVFDYADAGRRQKWFKDLFKPEAQMLSRSYRNIHNIATWQRATEAKVALLYDDESLWNQAVNSTFGLKAQFARGVTSDYFWYEQSMGYNSFILMATDSLFTFTGLLGQRDRLLHEAEMVQNMMLAPLAIRFPNNQLPNPADNTAIPVASTYWLAKTYRTLPTRIGLIEACGSYDWNTLIDPPDALVEELGLNGGAMPDVVSRSMDSSCFALLKSEEWQVFFHYGQLTRSHAQAEALNWSAAYGKLIISQDVGTVGYASPLSKGYYRKGLAQNVPLVGGEGQERWGRGELLEFDAEAAVVCAEQPDYRNNVLARRHLQLKNHSLVDTTTVELRESCTPAPLGLSLHLEGTLRVDSKFTAITPEVFAADRPPSFQHWSDLYRVDCNDSVTIPMTFEDGTILDIELACDGPFTLYLGSAPGHPPSRHMGFYLETPPALEATFTTTIGPHPVEPLSGLAKLAAFIRRKLTF